MKKTIGEIMDEIMDNMLDELDEPETPVIANSTDAARLDWLEEMANQKGGILLHDGSETGRTGLGLRPGNLKRTLRQAIDSAMRF